MIETARSRGTGAFIRHGPWPKSGTAARCYCFAIHRTQKAVDERSNPRAVRRARLILCDPREQPAATADQAFRRLCAGAFAGAGDAVSDVLCQRLAKLWITARRGSLRVAVTLW